MLTKNKLNVAFLTLVILCDFLGMAIVVVLFPKLLLGNTGMLAAWSHESRFLCMGVLMAIYPFGQVFGASAFAKYSDFYGRRKILLLTLIGTIVSFAGSALAVESSSILLLFVSRLSAGLCAGNVSVAQAALLDISTNETRAKNISWGQLAMGSGYIIGPILGGLLSNDKLVSWFNLSTPFWFFTVVLSLVYLVTYATFAETNQTPKKVKIKLAESFVQIYQGLTSVNLRGAFSVWLVFVSGWWLFESFFPTFLLVAHHYDTTQIGYILSYNGLLYALFQYLVVQKIAKKCAPEKMVNMGVFLVALSIFSLTMITTLWELYAAMTLFVMAMGFTIPGIITFIANLSEKDNQGQAMGIVNSIQAVSTVLVMLAAGYMNSINVYISIIISAALIGFSGIMFLYLQKCISPTPIAYQRQVELAE